MSPVTLKTQRFALCSFSVLSLALTLSANLPAQQTNESELTRYSQQAEQAMKAKDWTAATRALEKLSQLAPNVP